MKRLLIGLVTISLLAACATFDAWNATPGQKAFAVASDYAALSGTAAAYVVLPTANEDIKHRIKRADAKAYPAVETMKTVALGDLPEFCSGDVPDDVGLSLAASACSNDLPAVVRQARLLVQLLALAVKDIDQ